MDALHISQGSEISLIRNAKRKGGGEMRDKNSQVINISIFRYSDEICYGGFLVMVIRRRMKGISKDD